MADAKAMEIAELAAAELRAGYDPDALLESLLPILLALAAEYLGRAAVSALLEETLDDWRC